MKTFGLGKSESLLVKTQSWKYSLLSTGSMTNIFRKDALRAYPEKAMCKINFCASRSFVNYGKVY